MAIESSCDETAAAVAQVLKNGIVPLANVTASQIKIHRKTQGVVPEVAARAHIQKINAVTRSALSKANIVLNKIDLLAVTTGPGLVTSLMVGTEYVKGLSFALNKKIMPVNHMLGHLYSAFLQNPALRLPSMNLIVSGGHTYLVFLKNKKEYKVIGQTVDDAAGEAFDKVAKMLELDYPGGPLISKQALGGKRDYRFPRPMLNSKDYNFSFAGLKTAVLYKIRNQRLNVHNKQTKADIAFSFQNAIVEVLVSKTIRAAQSHKAKSITISGGVAANKKLRQAMRLAAEKIGATLCVPDFSLCTDNALMIANAAAIKMQNGIKPVGFAQIKVNPNLEL